jgi:hypothetical protein
MSHEIQLAKDLVELKAAHAEAKKKTSGLFEDVKNKQQELIDFLLEEGKKSTGVIDGVGNFTIARSVYPSVKAEALPRFIDSLRGTSDFGIVKETIHPSTLKSFLKQKIEATVEEVLEHPEWMEKYEGDTPSQVAYEIWAKKDVQVFEDFVLRHTKGK